jgi:hypothetical protein
VLDVLDHRAIPCGIGEIAKHLSKLVGRCGNLVAQPPEEGEKILLSRQKTFEHGPV